MNEILQELATANEKQLDEILFGIELIMQGATAEEAIAALIARRENEA